jgi:hypothetical protein
MPSTTTLEPAYTTPPITPSKAAMSLPALSGRLVRHHGTSPVLPEAVGVVGLGLVAIAGVALSRRLGRR